MDFGMRELFMWEEVAVDGLVKHRILSIGVTLKEAQAGIPRGVSPPAPRVGFGNLFKLIEMINRGTILSPQPVCVLLEELANGEYRRKSAFMNIGPALVAMTEHKNLIIVDDHTLAALKNQSLIVI